MYAHRKDITSTDIYHVETKEDAVSLEKYLTNKFSPKYDESFKSGYGYSSHARRLGIQQPAWALDDEKIKQYVESRFPKFNTSREQRKSAFRLVRLIFLYYRIRKTNEAIAKELKMSLNAVDCALHRIATAMGGPLNPVGRPRKNAVGLQETSVVNF
jgi:hypothetical protein